MDGTVNNHDMAVVTITPLLQSDVLQGVAEPLTEHQDIRMARWGNENNWNSIPATWQPASDVEDEWQHVELTCQYV